MNQKEISWAPWCLSSSKTVLMKSPLEQVSTYSSAGRCIKCPKDRPVAD